MTEAVLNVLFQVSPVVCTTTANSSPPPLTHTIHKTTPIAPNVAASQNYIPQNEEKNNSSTNIGTTPNGTPAQSAVPTREPDEITNTESHANVTTTEATQENEFNVLDSLLPETVSKAVSDLLLRPPPKLKPRPPGPLSTVFDEGVPSSAGNVTAKINSISHRVSFLFLLY